MVFWLNLHTEDCCRDKSFTLGEAINVFWIPIGTIIYLLNKVVNQSLKVKYASTYSNSANMIES
jgi:hypothetical protein